MKAWWHELYPNFSENAQTPYSATVVINDVQYGTGYASSKKNAKMDAGM